MFLLECENTDANGEVGRVIGEALTQTFDNLMNPQTAPREGVEVEEFTEEEDRILNGDPAPVRAPRAPTGVTFSKGPVSLNIGICIRCPDNKILLLIKIFFRTRPHSLTLISARNLWTGLELTLEVIRRLF